MITLLDNKAFTNIYIVFTKINTLMPSYRKKAEEFVEETIDILKRHRIYLPRS